MRSTRRVSWAIEAAGKVLRVTELAGAGVLRVVLPDGEILAGQGLGTLPSYPWSLRCGSSRRSESRRALRRNLV